MTKECIWHKELHDPKSTTGIDMWENANNKCKDCPGWDNDCDKKIEDEDA